MMGIYKIVNLINNKIYIGQSRDIDKRWKMHIYELNHNIHVNPHLQGSWNKYGEKNFAFEIICLVDNEKELNNLEKYYISYYNATNDEVGYNMTTGGEGWRLTEDVKKRMSIHQRCNRSTLTEKLVSEIKIKMANGIDRKTLSEEYGVSAKVLTNISTGKNFGWVLPELNDVIHLYFQKEREKRDLFILEKYDSGMKIREISKEFSISESIVEKCIYKNRPIKKNYKNRKLSEEQEKEIVCYYKKGIYTVKELAALFNVSMTKIYYLLKEVSD